MSKIDRVKEEIAWIKVCFVAFLAIDVSLVGWIAQRYQHANVTLIALAIVSVLAMTSALVWLCLQVYARLRQLEDL